LFHICRRCDRGQRYCTDHCREKARRSQRRQANRKHQQSPEGRLDHRDRQRQWRARERGRVTDQGREPAAVFVTIPPPAVESADKPEERPPEQGPEEPKRPDYRLLVCIVCGRSGQYIETFYRSG